MTNETSLRAQRKWPGKRIPGTQVFGARFGVVDVRAKGVTRRGVVEDQVVALEMRCQADAVEIVGRCGTMGLE